MGRYTKWFNFSGAALAAALLLTGCVIRVERNDKSTSHEVSVAGFTISKSQSPALDIEILQFEPIVSGKWTAQLSSGSGANESVMLSVTERRGSSTSVNGLARSIQQFPFLRLQETWRSQFLVTNEAGVMEFRGTRNDKKASGTFLFTANAEYVRVCRKNLAAEPSSSQLFDMALHQVSASDIEKYSRGGLPLTAGDICGLKAYGASPEYFLAVREAGDFSVDEVKRLRSFGVPEDYPAAIAKAGYKFNASDLTRMRSYGVSANEAVAWKAGGNRFEAEEIAKLHSYGVTPEFGAAVKNLLGNPSVEDLIKLKSYGVSEQYVSEMKGSGATFSVEELVKLKSYGVPAEYVSQWRKAGFNFDAQELIRLRSYGVQVGFASLKDAGFGVDDMVKLHSYGVSPDYVSEWRKAGYKFSAFELVKLKSAGVPSSYAAVLTPGDRKPLSAETIVRLRQRGLSAEEIKELRE